MSSSELQKTLLDIRKEIIQGRIGKRFHDEYFVFDLLKVLYEDSTDITTKTELLIVVEEYGGSGVDSSSVDQIVVSLLDILQQIQYNENTHQFCCQLIITATSLLIQFDQLTTSVCTSLLNTLLTISTSHINIGETKRLRACACQCLLQIEDHSPGRLWKHRETFVKILKQERSDIFQDYAQLLVKLLEYCVKHETSSLESSVENEDQVKNVCHFDRQLSIDTQEFRQAASFIMDHQSIFTPCGLWHILQSLAQLVQTTTDISPTIFKSFLLHHIATMDLPLLHLVLSLQMEFIGEILSSTEEELLLQRLIVGLNHPSLTPVQRLLLCHWLKHYQKSSHGGCCLPDIIRRRNKLQLYPSVFDPIDCQRVKILLLNLTFDTDVKSSVMLESLSYLHKLVWYSKSGKLAVSLFRCLYQIYSHHHSLSMYKYLQNFISGLISAFPIFIPHALMFIECVKTETPKSPVFLDILLVLQALVVSADYVQTKQNFDVYLKVLKKSALQEKVNPKSTVLCLQNFADNASDIDNGSWHLGNEVLAVCRNLLICHGTFSLYTDLGELLFSLMMDYPDADIQDKARFLYALITGASDEKIKGVLEDTVYGASTVSQALSTLLPGSMSTIRQAEIEHIDKPVLTWKRVSMKPVWGMSNSLTCLSKLSDGTIDNLEQMNEYLNEMGTWKVHLEAECELEISPDSDFDELQAVSIHINACSLYEAIPDKHLLSLSKSEAETILIKLVPKKPTPWNFYAWSTFATKKKFTFTCDLPGLQLDFSHFMLPMPWVGQLKEDVCGRMFTSLWSWLIGERKCDRDGIQSVKILEMNKEQYLAKADKRLEQFKISKDAEVELRYAILLPPHYHLLLTARVMEDQTVVSIATDVWSILTSVDEFLESFSEL